MWLYIAIAGLLAVGVLPWVPEAFKLLPSFGKGTAAKPDRKAMLAAYDTLAAGLVDVPETTGPMTAIWSALGRKA